jgi:hypothetical protein
MCAVSYVGDYWKDTLPNRHPWVYPSPGTVPLQPSMPWGPPAPPGVVPTPLSPVIPWVPGPGNGPTREEFDKLRDDVQELKKLLTAAKEYDRAVGEPDCEMDEKVALIRAVAKYVGVDLSGIFDKGSE